MVSQQPATTEHRKSPTSCMEFSTFRAGIDSPCKQQSNKNIRISFSVRERHNGPALGEGRKTHISSSADAEDVASRRDAGKYRQPSCAQKGLQGCPSTHAGGGGDA